MQKVFEASGYQFTIITPNDGEPHFMGREIADALGDMMYILCGTILSHGLQDKIERIFEEIQKSNMSKLGKDGKPIYREDGKIMKGPGYFKPNIKKELL